MRIISSFGKQQQSSWYQQFAFGAVVAILIAALYALAALIGWFVWQLL